MTTCKQTPELEEEEALLMTFAWYCFIPLKSEELGTIYLHGTCGNNGKFASRSVPPGVKVYTSVALVMRGAALQNPVGSLVVVLSQHFPVYCI